MLEEKANEAGVALDMTGEFTLPVAQEVRKDDTLDYVRLLLQFQHLQSLSSSGAQLTMVFNGAKAKRILAETIHESNLEKVEQKLQKLERKLQIRSRWSQDHPQFMVCIYVTVC